ncbi:acyltransferase family protein [Nocardioides pacificus]
MPTPQSLSAAFDPRRNSLNALRLALATAVIVSHSWAIGDFGPEPSAGGAHLGTWAVLGFFALSGFLITRSRLRLDAARYYEARALRILPAFLVCLLVTAVVFAPLSALKAGSWDAASAITYVLRNLALYPPSIAQDGIACTLAGVPFAGMWNGSLWTLFWEAGCYLLVGGVVSAVPAKYVRGWLAAGFILASVGSLVAELGVVTAPGITARAMPMVAAFLAGSIVFLWSDRLSMRPATLVVAGGMLAAATGLGLVQSLGALPIAILLLWLGAFPDLASVGSVYDISYGVYIYAWPVQQMVVLTLGDRLNVGVMIALSVAGTVPLAYLSCRAVEKPALRFKARSSVPVG